MATVAETFGFKEEKPDLLSGTPRAHAIDRWIFVFMAAWFIAIVLTGFIPDSLEKIELVRTGQRPPFPLILHAHAVLMGAFLLLLLAQTWLMATGRREYHMRLGMAAFVLVPALVAVGFILVPTMYFQILDALQTAPPEARERLQAALSRAENIRLLQVRAGILFPLFVVIALRARGKDSGLHKRMMVLATAIPLAAGFNRIHWLPTTMPASPIGSDLYTLAVVSPMFLWDVVRNQRIHRAYWIWLGPFLASSLVVSSLWDTPWWHAVARQMLGL
jgi:hypothetical protein